MPAVALPAREGVADLEEILLEHLAGRGIEVFESPVRLGGGGLHPGGDGRLQVERVGGGELPSGEIEVVGPELEPGMAQGRLVQVGGDEARLGGQVQGAEVLLQQQGDAGACPAGEGLEAGTEVGTRVQEGFPEVARLAQQDCPGRKDHGAQDASVSNNIGANLHQESHWARPRTQAYKETARHSGVQPMKLPNLTCSVRIRKI